MAWENLYTRVDSELKKEIDEYVASNKVSIREIVEEAVREWLAKRK